MPSVREQNFAYVEAKLEAVRAALNWSTMVRNPEDEVGTDQMNAIVMMDGGDREPDSLTGGVGDMELEFAVGMLVATKANAAPGAKAKDLLDAGFVAISNALLDPDDIQLGGLAVGIRRLGMDDPFYGRADRGAVYVGGQAMMFAVRYFEREGDASSVGP